VDPPRPTAPAAVHATLATFEKDWRPAIPDRAVADLRLPALSAACPTPTRANLTVDTPALLELAKKKHRARRRQDFKTGQTFMKTSAGAGVQGAAAGGQWLVLDNIPWAIATARCWMTPSPSRARRSPSWARSSTSCKPHLYPDLYGKMYHSVHINYYPRAETQGGLDNIDIFGGWATPCRFKVNFLCRDSILAAPVVLDLALFMDLAQRSGMHGIQEWLSFYWKEPDDRRESCTPSTTHSFN